MDNFPIWKTWASNYVSEFLSLKCAGDVLNVVSPLGVSAQKEITESMAVIKRLRDIVLSHPMRFTLYDLCAGNALTSVTAAHLLPVKRTVAIDIKTRKRNWDRVKRFTYETKNIYELAPDYFESESIIISVHPCKKLAQKVVQLYKESASSHLIVMPCCGGALSGRFQYICDKLGKYTAWCMDIANICNGSIHQDVKVLSPKNILITAMK